MTNETAQEIIDLLTLNGRKQEHIKNGERVVYLADAISIVKKALDDQDQPNFAVGEYYATKTGIVYKVTAVQGLELKVTSLIGQELVNSSMLSDAPIAKHSTPATAEQVALFKRAEEFASKGRKLDEFHVGDLINCSKIPADNGYFTGDLVINKIGNVMFTAATNYGLRAYYLRDLKKTTLIQTAEELQEEE
jgi:hypothetical protein